VLAALVAPLDVHRARPVGPEPGGPAADPSTEPTAAGGAPPATVRLQDDASPV
jgi:hypothetical protein